ncbi:hypothetical protein V493_07496 [Pseudogymnoascus sp. VKM F-4281 (FW-2241)]|nr:hypothetical protein V493_07496 [Pseudogymnoascus sp. VKM F-4281 (FW-2241)]
MDEAYNQHSPHIRRHNRSSTSLNALSLAPLTSRFPIDDADEAQIPQRPRPEHRLSYLESPSVPPSPGILSSSRSPSRSRLQRRKSSSGIPKSKSSTQIHKDVTSALYPKAQLHKSGALTPGPRPTHGHKHRSIASEDFTLGFFNRRKPDDDDWLLRTGSLITSASRESKGQAWLVSRASSTSLAGLDNDEDSEEDDRVAEYGFVRSRRPSGDADDELSPVTTRSFAAHSRNASRFASRTQSRAHSRVQSRRGSRSGLVLTPLQAQDMDSYFQLGGINMAKPDFVDVDEDPEAEPAQALHDEMLMRRLAKTGTLGLGTWVERLMGWSLFAVEEDGEETDGEWEERETETTDTDGEGYGKSRKEQERQRWREMLEKEAKEQGVVLPPPPEGSEEGGWGDAAWLLSVATKVLL